MEKIKEIIKAMPYNEGIKTNKLFYDFKHIKKQGYLTKDQLIDVLRWKSTRPIKHYKSNIESEIIEITRKAFSEKNEKLKIHILTAFNGVRYPGASALLMFFDPKNYPVIDIRVWQQLYKTNMVNSNPKGQNFTLNHWIDYLLVIRKIAKDLGLTARQVEKRIFDYDQQTRSTNLYK